VDRTTSEVVKELKSRLKGTTKTSSMPILK